MSAIELAHRGAAIYNGLSIYLTVSGISKRKHSEWDDLHWAQINPELTEGRSEGSYILNKMRDEERFRERPSTSLRMLTPALLVKLLDS